MKTSRALIFQFQQYKNISMLVAPTVRSRIAPVTPWETYPTFLAHKFIRTTLPTVRTMSSTTKASANMIVEHEPSANKFFIRIGEGGEAKLEYVKNGNTLNMWHTEVPQALQGQGIAKVLAQGAFDHAVKNNLKMLLTCTYLQKFYRDNPKDEYKKLVQ